MPTTRQSATDPPAPRQRLDGPTHRALVHREVIDWHHHDEHQLIHPSRGVLRVSTPLGDWVVPPYRAVWIPAGVPHAHQAHGPTDMRTLSFAPARDPLGADQPTVLAVSPLLRELIVALTEEPGPGRPPYTPVQRGDLERVALDQLRRVDALPLHLPAPADDRLRAVAALLQADPADERSLAELGAAVGAGERTLSRLFRRELGMTFPQWRTQLRLHHAFTLLAAGRSVTSTGSACGYANASAFIEAFRHAFGTTPGRLRAP
ncbi:transcriptional regulator, AraC family [Actinacidiphila yanglinensis]|uniref:HTH-type transcriptional regulator RipA n=1 Tax=Actinacidiphila yanglinensis TaxID=310779 RepID=A0A1H5Z590_9ACTN|nr:helix-turn-helix transcriptional regulator [Actinacidiphila yanglinensis]SEG31442.1 transcriptional regulator, AraC family [Actinacidiphila yanglinensis]